MALLTGSALSAELQRKKNLGIQPTNSNNLAAYNQLSVTSPKTTTALNPTNNGTAVRKYFNDAGYTDVTYDKPTNTVRVNGVDVLSPSKIVNGTSYANTSDLDSALSRLQNRETTKQVNDLLGQLTTAVNTPYQAPEFSYDINTDPQYQAALKQAQANAQTASGNAMAELNKRGILNSSITSDRLGQIEQAAYNDVSSNLVPQLMQQAYGRYRDSVGDAYNANRNQISDLANLLGLETSTNQQQLDNNYRNETFAYQQARDAIADKQYQQQFDENVRQFGLNYALNKAQLDHQISNDAAQNAISMMNARTSAANANLNQQEFNWSKDPNNLDNIYKKAQIDQLNAKTPTSTPISAKESANNLSQAKTNLNGVKTKDEAMQYAQGISGYLSDSDYRALLSYIDDNY